MTWNGVAISFSLRDCEMAAAPPLRSHAMAKSRNSASNEHTRRSCCSRLPAPPCNAVERSPPAIIARVAMGSNGTFARAYKSEVSTSRDRGSANCSKAASSVSHWRAVVADEAERCGGPRDVSGERGGMPAAAD
eukprot:scaffold207840_cov28-Tisochrysis_lutea.AAC.4